MLFFILILKIYNDSFLSLSESYEIFLGEPIIPPPIKMLSFFCNLVISKTSSSLNFSFFDDFIINSVICRRVGNKTSLFQPGAAL